VLIDVHHPFGLLVVELCLEQFLLLLGSIDLVLPYSEFVGAKLLNLGENRWSFKPELGISKAIGAWTVDVMPSVTFYTDNTEFKKVNTLSQTPVFAIQGHVIYSFASKIWVAFDTTYFSGNRTTVNGVLSDNLQVNTRAGLTLAIPVDRYNSVIQFMPHTGYETKVQWGCRPQAGKLNVGPVSGTGKIMRNCTDLSMLRVRAG